MVALTGCMMGPDFKPPVVETPGDYRFEERRTEDSVNLKWWELFNDPQIYDLVNQALQNNRDVKIAAERIEQARATLGFTEADIYPSITLEGAATIGNYFGGPRSDTTDTYAYIAPALSWEIDFWGKFRRANESARADLMASESGLLTVQLGLIAEVAATYYLLLDYNERLAVSKRTLASRKESVNIIQQRFEKGIVPELDLNQAEIQFEIAAAAIPLYERLMAKTENVLSILIGRLPQEIPIGDELKKQNPPPEIPTGLPSTLLERRPDITGAMYDLAAQNAQIGFAEALRFPAVSLNGLAGAASNEVANITNDGGIWRAGGGLLGPLFEFGKNIRRVEVEEAKTKQALFQYEKVVLNAFREVEDALVEINTYKRQLNAIENRLKAARNANDLSNQRYDLGVASYLEVLETERTLFNVELERSETTQNYFASYVNLYKALGGGWITKDDATE
jgi:multidrug efflux system outer membrane protein